MVLVGLVVYSISIDQVVSVDLVPGLFVGGDILVSAVVLSWAGKNLLQGAAAIGSQFDISFEREREKIEQYRTALNHVIKERKK